MVSNIIIVIKYGGGNNCKCWRTVIAYVGLNDGNNEVSDDDDDKGDRDGGGDNDDNDDDDTRRRALKSIII